MVTSEALDTRRGRDVTGARGRGAATGRLPLLLTPATSWLCVVSALCESR